ncbi:MAG: GNAT family N-acetyltransferase [Bacteroidia bacterium]|nr:GNAT family N-acetyltransferase [Bacteroidia bacterium]
MKFAPFTAQDLIQIPSIQPEEWGDIRPHLQNYLDQDFSFPIKLEEDGKLIGIGAGIVHENIAWLGHIIVHRDYRKQGLGSKITQTLVEQMQAKGCESIFLIATDLGATVYEKLGFETQTTYEFYKELRFEPKDLETQNIVAYQPEYFNALAQLDFEISGEKRMFHLEPFLNEASLFIKDGNLCGYYLPKLGDGMINANTAEAGIELMKHRFKDFDYTSFPKNNQVAKDFLKHFGYTTFREAKRMHFGLNQTWKAENIYNRIGGNLG